jgi:class 3 adenylate cyclase
MTEIDTCRRYQAQSDDVVRYGKRYFRVLAEMREKHRLTITNPIHDELVVEFPEDTTKEQREDILREFFSRLDGID